MGSRWVAGVIGAGLLFLLAMAVGEACHYATLWLTKKFVDVANVIDARTPDGTTGVVGFAIVTLGFLLQFIATWLGRPS